MKKPVYTLEPGRNIYREGKPFVAVTSSAVPGAAPDAGEADTFTRQLVEMLGAFPLLRETLRQGIADARAVVDRWESGDLAGAVNGLDGWQDYARRVFKQTRVRR